MEADKFVREKVSNDGAPAPPLRHPQYMYIGSRQTYEAKVAVGMMFCHGRRTKELLSRTNVNPVGITEKIELETWIFVNVYIVLVFKSWNRKESNTVDRVIMAVNR